MLHVDGAAPEYFHKFVAALQERPRLEFIARKSGTWQNFHADSVLVQHGKSRYVLVGLAEHADGEEWLRRVAPIADDLVIVAGAVPRAGAHSPHSVGEDCTRRSPTRAVSRRTEGEFMDRNRTSFGMLLALTLALAAPLLATWRRARRVPPTLEQCYLDVAARKGDADAVHLAREICDEVFRRGPRSLTRLVKNECVEWWFDAEGRYESADLYCSLEVAGDANWKLACQWKSTNKPYTFVELAPSRGKLSPVGELRGKPLGPFFTSLGACIEERAGATASP